MRPLLILVLLCSGLVMRAQSSLESIRALGVDMCMTDETAAYLRELHDTKQVFVGQHNGVWMEERNGIRSHISSLTGKLPSMVSYDYMFITNRNNKNGTWYRAQQHQIRENIIAADRAGIYVTMCWHYNEPYLGNTFYTEHMQDKQHAQIAFRSIMKGGENHDQYKKDLRTIAEFTTSLIDDDGKLIPILFRPFHEFDGEWFWWGAPYNTPQEFIDVWQFTVSYLRDTLEVHNMLYAFSPDIRFQSKDDYLLRYPGDDYVDVLGFDDYEDFKYDEARTGEARKRIKILAEIGAERMKPVGLTETGYFVKFGDQREEDLVKIKNMLKTLTEMEQYVDFILFWANGSTWDYCISPPGTIGDKEFEEFFRQSFFFLLE